MSRHAAPELPPPTRGVGAAGAATPIGARRSARAWLLLALACAALLIAAPVAIVRSSTSPDDAGREAEVSAPSDPDGDDGSTGEDGGAGAVPSTAAPVPDGAVPPVPGAPPAGGSSGWTQPGTRPITVLPSSSPTPGS